jgi:glycosyltransferase involved in cell wall biosynthesis
MFTNSYCHFTHTERLREDERWRVEQTDGIRVIWLKTPGYTGNGWKRGLNMLWNAWRCIQVARTLDGSPDVVIGPSVPILTGWTAGHLARRRRAAFVYEVRDLWPIALVHEGALSKWSPIYFAFRLIEKSVYRTAQRISSVLPLIHDHVAKSGGDPQKVAWVPNGADLERFPPSSVAYDGGSTSPLVAMYVGGYSVGHDVVTIVKAAGILEKRRPGAFRFLLIGNGMKREACEEEARRSSMSTVEFRDRVPKHEVPEVQTHSDVLIASITKSDSFRYGINLNKMYDYFASARPIVFSGSAPNDPIAESGAGFSVPPEDPEAMAAALERLLDMGSEGRRKLGEKGRRYVELNYDMRVLGRRMEELLLEAIKERA